MERVLKVGSGPLLSDQLMLQMRRPPPLTQLEMGCIGYFTEQVRLGLYCKKEK